VDDIEAIKQLKARYFRTMDTKDWKAMRQVFTDDLGVCRNSADEKSGIGKGKLRFRQVR